jgi:hypothetical protein
MELGKDFENAPISNFSTISNRLPWRRRWERQEEDFETRIEEQTILDAALEAVMKLLPEDVEISKTAGLESANWWRTIPEWTAVGWDPIWYAIDKQFALNIRNQAKGQSKGYSKSRQRIRPVLSPIAVNTARIGDQTPFF